MFINDWHSCLKSYQTVAFIDRIAKGLAYDNWMIKNRIMQVANNAFFDTVFWLWKWSSIDSCCLKQVNEMLSQIALTISGSRLKPKAWDDNTFYSVLLTWQNYRPNLVKSLLHIFIIFGLFTPQSSSDSRPPLLFSQAQNRCQAHASRAHFGSSTDRLSRCWHVRWLRELGSFIQTNVRKILG